MTDIRDLTDPAAAEDALRLQELRVINLEKLAAWVAHMRYAARADPDPDLFLLDAHDMLGRRMSQLELGIKGSEGLTAFDLGEAQAKLMRPLSSRDAMLKGASA